MTQKPKPNPKRKRHPNWGGRRPGAGAPRGNMNALKHGRRSARMTNLGRFFASNPKTRAELLAIADRWDQKQMKAEAVAEEIFAQILHRGIRIGEARAGKPGRAGPAAILDDPSRLFVLPPVPDRQSIEPNDPETERLSPSPAHGRGGRGVREQKSHHPIDQDRRTNPHHRSRSKRKTPLDRT